MEKWQFTVLFFVGVGGAVLLLLGPDNLVNHNPTAVTGVGAILTYVLSKGVSKAKKDKKEDNQPIEEDEEVS